MNLDKNYYLWENAKNYILNGGMLLSKIQLILFVMVVF